jgi:adenylate kinase
VYIVFLGAPGAGKGTQAAVVAERLGLAHVATGDMFREAQAKGTKLGLEAKGYMEKGELVPNEITVGMLVEKLASPECREGAIFDGFPRNLEQAEALDGALADLGKSIDEVVYIKVSEEELLGRLGGRLICRACQTPYHEVSSPPFASGKCDRCGGELYQRPDDNPGTIKERLKVFFEQTSPLVDHYTQVGKLLEVNGEGDVDEIRERILAALGRVAR